MQENAHQIKIFPKDLSRHTNYTKISMVTLETIDRKIDRIIALLDRPLTPIQREILEYIRSRGSATQRDLRSDLGLGQSTVSYATRVLVKKQMIRERWNGKIKSYEVPVSYTHLTLPTTPYV